MLVAKCWLPRPPRPPRAMTIDSPAVGEVVDDVAGLEVVQDGSDWDLQGQALALEIRKQLLAQSVTSAARFVFGVEAEVDKRVVGSATTPSGCRRRGHRRPPEGPPLGTNFSPPEGHASVAAVAGLHTDSCFIDEHGVRVHSK